MPSFPAQEDVAGLEEVMSESAFLGLGSQSSEKHERDCGWEPQHRLQRRGKEQAVSSQPSTGWPDGQVMAAVLVGISPGSLDSGISGYKRQRTLGLSVGARTELSERASLVGTESALGVAVGESGAGEAAPCLPECLVLHLQNTNLS